MQFSDLEPWLVARGFAPERIEPLPGDVSPRRYARVRWAERSTEGSAIAAYYPEEIRPAAERYLRSTALLEGVEVPVPRVLAVDLANGWMLIEDLGERTLAERRDLDDAGAAPYFRHAAELGRRIASLPPAALLDEASNAPWNPPLDGPLLRRELQQTWDVYLLPRGLLGTAAERRATETLFDEICARLGAEPAVPCHRDFMARNLIPRANRPEGEVAVIDHQDLRFGPPRYDLASLANDTRFPLAALEAELLGALSGVDEVESYHRAAAQRTIKAVGTYAKFAERGAPRHLPLIPATLDRAIGHLARIPEGEAIASGLSRRWRPAGGGSAH